MLSLGPCQAPHRPALAPSQPALPLSPRAPTRPPAPPRPPDLRVSARSSGSFLDSSSTLPSERAPSPTLLAPLLVWPVPAASSPDCYWVP